ncbi:MAG: class I SAM-dependent methyltransferase [Planctomycetes bacterium]|nr:class I SAM-dependent methyltransferase [Planctomycetota bacterium]
MISNSAHSKNGDEKMSLNHWIHFFSVIENRLYYRDQSANSLNSLITLAQSHRPSIIVELGTLSGMSTRAWTLAVPNLPIHAVDFSFIAFWHTNEFFQVDTSNITFHEKNILDMDFTTLWSDSDRVLLFVDAHDMPDASIMRHVFCNALPHLPKDSLVVVDDVWYSNERLGSDNVQAYFNHFLLGQIDELQCFTGHYAPYHKDGSFMGFQEVLPLMDFINSHGIDLGFDPHGKHVWFTWDGERNEKCHPITPKQKEHECGSLEYNPLAVTPNGPLAARILPKAAQMYRLGQFQESATLLSDLVNKESSQAACFALAVCQARNGQLDDAHKMIKVAQHAGTSNWRVDRLACDLEERVGRPKVRMTGRKGLTIFAVPKAFKNHEDVIQKNAIRSWAWLEPKPEIILMGNDHGVREMALEVGARHIPDIATNEFGTPLVDDIFKKAWDAAANDILAYVNADIILMNDFQVAANKGGEQFSEFLVIGQRWNLPVWEAIDFSRPWVEHIKNEIQANGFLESVTGLDYFIHARGLWRGIPPFALGRTAWDNWLVKRPFEDGLPIIDGTGFITAIHQDHGYAHCLGGKRGAWHGVEDKRNRAMAGNIDENSFSTCAALMLDQQCKLVKRNSCSCIYSQKDYIVRYKEWILLQHERMKEYRQDEMSSYYFEKLAEL